MKTCNYKKCTNPVWSKGRCKWHPVERPKPLAPASDKRLEELKEYWPKCRQFKKDNPVCQIKTKGCTRKTTEVHHRKGRIGKWLLDMRYWLPACGSCHRFAELNPKIAKEKGYSESRLAA